MKVTRIGLDLAKNVFEIHGVDAEEQVAVRRTLRRGKVLEYFAQLPPCLIGMEACGGAHYWARELMKLGHDTRLMAPQFVAPYRKSNKSDRNDAQAICEALGRPSMPFVAVKDEEQQAVMMLHRMRSLLVGERTALVNQTRGLLGEFGIVVGQHIGRLRARLPQILEDGQRGLPTLARELFADLYRRLRELDAKIGAYDRGRADCVALRSDADNDGWRESAFARPIRRRSSRLRICAAQLFPKHAAQRALQVRAALTLDVLAQGLVDQGLIVSSAANAITEPLDDVRIEADGDPLLCALDDGAALALGEVVFVAHGSALLVVAALGNRGRPRRNDANGLLVGLGVNDDQDACEGVDPGQDETLFA